MLACLAATTLVLGLGSGSGAADRPAAQTAGDQEPPDPELVEQGRDLYSRGCVSCHGFDGKGVDAPDGSVRGPSLEEAGEAGAYFQLSTGRMPLASSDDIPQRKPPAYDVEEIEALVAYVTSLGDGPALPGIDISRADVAEGGVLYRELCQACHSATGAGGALSYGRAAPTLGSSTPTQVGAAVRSGPGPMPRFGPEILSREQLDDVSAYVAYLEDPEDRGGVDLGRLGPIPEGFMTWVGGLGLLLVVAFWLGRRDSTAPAVDPGRTPEDAPVRTEEDQEEPP